MSEFAIGDRVKRATWRNGSYIPEILIIQEISHTGIMVRVTNGKESFFVHAEELTKG